MLGPREGGRQSKDDANAKRENLCRCHESDHVDSGQVFDRSAEGSPNPTADQRQMGLAER